MPNGVYSAGRLNGHMALEDQRLYGACAAQAAASLLGRFNGKQEPRPTPRAQALSAIRLGAPTLVKSV